MELLELRAVAAVHRADAECALHERVRPGTVEMEEADRFGWQQLRVGYEIRERHATEQAQSSKELTQVARHDAIAEVAFVRWYGLCADSDVLHDGHRLYSGQRHLHPSISSLRRRAAVSSSSSSASGFGCCDLLFRLFAALRCVITSVWPRRTSVAIAFTRS